MTVLLISGWVFAGALTGLGICRTVVADTPSAGFGTSDVFFAGLVILFSLVVWPALLAIATLGLLAKAVLS